MTRPTASRRLLAALFAASALTAQAPPVNLIAGRCWQDLPLDAGQGFDHQRFLVWRDQAWLFQPAWATPGVRWRLDPRKVKAVPGPAAGLLRRREKWRDGALWMQSGRGIHRLDPGGGGWTLRAEPALEFMDFEVDMTGRILLVCTADPATRTYRSLLEAVAPGGHATTPLAPYPDPGCMAWAARVSPVAAATLQAGYEAVQILEFTVLFNPLARRLFVFRPLEDRLKEVALGLAPRGYAELKEAIPPEGLCWQVLPKDDTEAWLVMDGPGPGLTALPLDLFEGTAGEAVPLPGLSLPVFPDPSGQLADLETALKKYLDSAAAPPPVGAGPR